MADHPVMPGVSCQALGVHSGYVVANPIAIDQRDCVIFNETCRPHEFTCTHLVHYTENQFAASIGLLGTDEPFCFKPKECSITRSKSFNLTWWSPFPPADWNDVVHENLPFLFDEFGEIGNSPAFNGPSLCGPLGFVTEWKDILGQYAISRQANVDDIELRVLGTFLYTKEIMYAVLVCIKGDLDDERFPLIHSGGTEAFVPMSTNFIWKAFSTIGFGRNRPSDVNWTWDHLSFGFNSPTSSLNIQPKFCTITRKDCTTNIPLSRREQYRRRTPESMFASQLLIDSLEGKIRSSMSRLVG